MNTYWIHVLRTEPTTPSLTIALSDTPSQIDFGNPLPTVTYDSWKQLSALLTRVGVTAETLRKTKARIESEGFDTLAGMPLSEEQLKMLGFWRRPTTRSAVA